MSDFSDEADGRYTSHFGPLNQILEVANHTFVLIDAPGLVEEDYRRSERGVSYARWAADMTHGPIAFVQRSRALIGERFRASLQLTYTEQACSV